MSAQANLNLMCRMYEALNARDIDAHGEYGHDDMIWHGPRGSATGEPPVIIRDHLIEHGYFDMDPCNLHKGEAEIVADCLVDTLDQACTGKITGRLLTDIRRARTDGVVGWLT